MAMFTANEYLVEDPEDLDRNARSVSANSDPIVWGKSPISPKLKGKNNGALPKDKLKAFAPKKAAGATVALFKIKKNGKKFIVATKVANDKGNAFFRVNDRNGAKKTTYRAKYRPSPATNKAWTNKRTVR